MPDLSKARWNYRYPGVKSGKCQTCGHHIVVQRAHIAVDYGHAFMLVPEVGPFICMECYAHPDSGGALHHCTPWRINSTYLRGVPGEV